MFPLIHCIKIFFLSILIALPSIMANALDASKAMHQYVSVTWGVEHGLPHSSVNDIIQDRRGFIWIATQNGLARFDGQQFISYNASNSDLVNNLVTSLFVDSKNRLWIGGYKSIAYIQNGKIKTVMLEDSETWHVNDFIENKTGQILIATDKKLLLFHQEQIISLKIPDFPTYSFLSIEESIFVGGQGRLIQLKQQDIEIFELPDSAEDLVVNTLASAEEGLLLGTSSGMFLFAEGKISAHTSGLGAQNIKKILKDSDENLWLVTDTGLFRRPPMEGVFVRQSGGFNINQLYQDREKNLWFALNDEGVRVMWDGWVERFSMESGLRNANTWSMEKDKTGGLWVGTSEELYSFKDGTFKPITSGFGRLIYSLQSTDDGLLLGTRQGLYKLEQTGDISMTAFEKLKDLQINGFYEDLNGTTWVMTSKGLYQLSSGSVIAFGDPVLQRQDVRAMYQWPDKSYWIGTKNGLVAFPPQSTHVRVHDALKDAFITSITLGQDNTIWVSTYSNGIFYYKNEWHNITKKNGLIANNVFNVVSHKSHLWVSGFNGLYRIQLTEIEKLVDNKHHVFQPRALLSEEASFSAAEPGHCCHGVGSSKVLVDGSALWYATNDGIVRVDSAEEKVNKILPMIAITEISTANEKIDTTVSRNRAIKISARDVKISFATLSFQNVRANRFLVKLSGVDSTWRNIDNGNSVFYTNLSPGHYLFEMQGSNNAGYYADSVSSIRFEVVGTFIESFWFKSILLFVSVSLFYLIYNLLKLKSHQQLVVVENQVDKLHAENHKQKLTINRLEHFVQNHAYVDELTGAYTYKFLETQLNMDIPYYERTIPVRDNSQESIVFVLVDIDNFKQVNFDYSREVGNLILQQIANLLKRTIRDSDYVVRLRSDTFLVIFRPVFEESISIVTERIRTLVEHCKFVIDDERYIQVTGSISFADYPIFPEIEHRLSWRQLIELTEKGMAEVKAAGGNRWIGYQLNEYIIKVARESDKPFDLEDLHLEKILPIKSWKMSDTLQS